MNPAEVRRYRKEINSAWTLVDRATLSRAFAFPSFRTAIAFVTAVAEVAEHENHHPDIHIFYQSVQLDLSTHAIKGLSQNDFILAKKIDLIEEKFRKSPPIP